MLVLSRKIGEKVEIGDGIVVTLLEIRDRQVRLGIEAPREIAVLREEVAAEIRRNHVQRKVRSHEPNDL